MPIRLSRMISSARSRVGAAAEAVEGVGEAVLVQRAGEEAVAAMARRSADRRGGKMRRGGEEDGGGEEADQRADRG